MSFAARESDKPKMPNVLKELGAKAIERLERRGATPEIAVVANDGGWTFDSPYDQSDRSEWEALLFEAFATRSVAVFHVFTEQLAKLCDAHWDPEQSIWMPDGEELRAAVQIVRSTRPRNEAEACMAAQMVAVHLMQMKLSAQALTHSWAEPRTCAIAGKLARTYAMQLETMAKLKGRGSRQRITVRKFSRHEHKHIHLHQGASENGNQPHGPKGGRTNQDGSLIELAKGPALPSPNSAEHPLSVPGRKAPEAVSIARGRDRIRGSRRAA